MGWFEARTGLFCVCGNGWCRAPKNKGGKSVVTRTFLTASLLGKPFSDMVRSLVTQEIGVRIQSDPKAFSL